MTTITRKFVRSLSFSTLPSYASGDEARSLGSEVANLKEKFAGAESLDAQAMRELQNVFLDSRESDWDGYGASPVEDETYVRAKLFLDQCLGRFPAPSSAATPSGSLAFEWYVSPGRRFMVTISEDDEIAYAGLFGSASIQGTDRFISELPPTFWSHLNRLYLR